VTCSRGQWPRNSGLIEAGYSGNVAALGGFQQSNSGLVLFRVVVDAPDDVLEAVLLVGYDPILGVVEAEAAHVLLVRPGRPTFNGVVLREVADVPDIRP